MSSRSTGAPSTTAMPAAPIYQIALGGEEPAITSRFVLAVDGVQIGIFKELSGLELNVATVEITEGGQNAFSYKMPGRMSWSPIKLTRGLTHSDALLDWVNKSSGVGFAGNNNQLTRCTGHVSAVSFSGQWLRTWKFQDVWPTKWTGPSFSAQSGNRTQLEESIEFVHNGFQTETFQG